MTWRDQLHPGSFRGVRFHTADAEGQFGRRVTLHEYPLQDLPYAEDMGRKARELAIEVYVIGPNYMAERDALVAAVEQAGPGTLVHHYLGQMQVVITGCRMRESSREGGMARFSLTVVEAGELQFPTAGANTASIVDGRADDAISAIEGDFASVFDTTGPEWLRDAAAGLVGQLSTALAGLPSGFVPGTSAMPGWLSALAGLGNASSLVTTPSSLAGTVTGIIGRLRGLFDGPTTIRASRKLFDFGSSLTAVPTTTAVRRQQATNQQAFVSLVRQAAVIEAARASSTLSFSGATASRDYASYQQVTALRDELAIEMEGEMLTASDTVYPVLAALRVAVVRDLTARGADLARLTSYRPGATVPALVVAHQVYGDATRADEVVSRNRIRHPGFVPGGEALEVLSG